MTTTTSHDARNGATAPASSGAIQAANFLTLGGLALRDELLDDLTKRAEAKSTGRPLGPITGMSKLDAVLSGALMPGVHHVHGSPGVGKTAFGLQIGMTCGVTPTSGGVSNCAALYVTAEMSALELLRRATARHTSTYLGKFKSGEMNPEYGMKLFQQTAATAPHFAFLDATRGPATGEVITHWAETLLGIQTQRDPEAHHMLIVVDSLHSWAARAYAGMTEYDALNVGIARLQEIAANFNCPILCINERSKAAKDGGQGAGAGSRKIEYSGESVIELDCKPDAVPDVNGDKEITVKVSKNRHGAQAGNLKLLFNGGFQRYSEG